MNCKQIFTRTFLRENLGKSYLETTYRRYLEDEYIRSEKALLPQTQPFVIYQQKRNEELAKVRFGKKPELPPMPLNGNSQTVFSCPVDNCRGYVQEDNHCALCKSNVCRFCRKIAASNHVCDVADMASVAFIHSDTKECPNPSCKVPIQKSLGCDHMYCTHCRTHFKWESLEILSNSTNGHYRNSPHFARYDVTVRTQMNQSDHRSRECQQDDSDALLKNAVNRADLSLIGADDLLISLYEDIDDIRCIKQHKFNERALTIKHVDHLIRLRMDFLTKKMTEEKWRKRIYDVKKQREKELAIQAVINVYLSTANYIQKTLRLKPGMQSNLKQQWIGFIELSNKCLNTIIQDYGGNPIVFKVDLGNRELPALTL